MADIDLEDAVTRLYEDSSITDELTDGPAQLLLQWGEARLSLMVNTSTDEERFEQDFKRLRLLLKSMNRFTGLRNQMNLDEQRDYLRRILQRGQELGFPAAWGHVGSFVDRQQLMDEAASVRALIALVETGASNISLM
jgi:hypothetical protein